MQQVSRTQRLVVIAALSAISLILMVFVQFSLPILPPAADFLKVDLSIVPILVAWAYLGTGAAYWVLIVRSLLKILLANEGLNTWIGLPVNVLTVGAFVGVFALIARRRLAPLWLMAAGVGATVVATVVALLINWLGVLPLYAHLMHFDVAQVFGSVIVYLAAIAMPFNLIQGFIWTVVAVILLPALKQILR